MRISLSRIHFPVTTLGPGRRVGIWFQGCSIRCVGCISPDTWTTQADTTTVSDVCCAVKPWLRHADGITISGGEPFDQQDGLLSLLTGLRQGFGGDVLVYSGYSIESLAEPLEKMRGLIDALISDPYDAAFPQRLALRGSDNQRLHFLSPRAEALYRRYESERGKEDDKLDLMIDPAGTVWMVGIPRRGDIERFVGSLKAAGHKAHLNQTASARRPKP